jgi:hypothetical protein
MTIKDYKRQIKISLALGEELYEPYLSISNFIDTVVENKDGKYYHISDQCIALSFSVYSELSRVFSEEDSETSVFLSVLIFKKISEKNGYNFKYYNLVD